MQREIKMGSTEKENLQRLVDLFLKMSFIGFDELQMNEREEVVQLFGEKLKWGIKDFDRRLTLLEEKISSLEEKIC